VSGERAGFYGRPYWWLWFAVVLFALPLLAMATQGGGGWADSIHPALNAILNGTSAAFLIAGGLAIRARRIELHRGYMLTAVGTSGVFLISYVIRFLTTGSHSYPGEGIAKIIYLAILFSHMILAVAVVPLVLITLSRALTARFDRHRTIARWTWPIWIYVSITGVIVYLMLYA
jgi:putative membrane protein